MKILKKIVLVIFCLIIFSNILLAESYSKQHIKLNIEVNNLTKSFNLDWNNDSTKIAIATNGVLYLADINGEIKQLKFLSKDDDVIVKWLGHSTIAIATKSYLEVFDVYSYQSHKYNIGGITDLDYNLNENKIVLASGAELIEVNLNDQTIQTHISWNEIYEVFYDERGTKIFFTAFGPHNWRYLYVYDLEEYTIDRFSEHYLYPYSVNHIDNIAVVNMIIPMISEGAYFEDSKWYKIDLQLFNMVPINDFKMIKYYDEEVSLLLNLKETVSEEKTKFFMISPDKRKMLYVENSLAEIVFLND